MKDSIKERIIKFVFFGIIVPIAMIMGLFYLPEPVNPKIRFGISTDAHLKTKIGLPQYKESQLKNFVEVMKEWKPDFIIDLGDFATQEIDGKTTSQEHNRQMNALIKYADIFSQALVPYYFVIGNHDVGWVKGGDEKIVDLYSPHSGEHITKDDWLDITEMPNRYYSFDIKDWHFIVLDGNNTPVEPTGKDGVVGAFWIDKTQRDWLEKDLKENSEKPKIVFSHEELYYQLINDRFTPSSYVDNGWQIREMFERDGNVRVVFAGHRHTNRHTIFNGIHYITLKDLYKRGSYTKVFILEEEIIIQGFGTQKNYKIK